jgi:hypothetical protein
MRLFDPRKNAADTKFIYFKFVNHARPMTHELDSQHPDLPGNMPKPLKSTPFKSGFVPNGKRRKKSGGYITKRSLLQVMLEVDITVADLPTEFADNIRKRIPGFLENVEKKFTIRQVMEMLQLQLLFSKSDYVVQDAIMAIKDRVDGKPLQKLQVESLEAEPTELILPNGRRLTI